MDMHTVAEAHGDGLAMVSTLGMLDHLATTEPDAYMDMIRSRVASLATLNPSPLIGTQKIEG